MWLLHVVCSRYNIFNCRSKSLSYRSFWSELNVKPKYLKSSEYLSKWLSIYNLGLNTVQYDLEELKDKSFWTLKS